jgi:hypothetical protein
MPNSNAAAPNSPNPSTKPPKAPGLEEWADEMAARTIRNLTRAAQEQAARDAIKNDPAVQNLMKRWERDDPEAFVKLRKTGRIEMLANAALERHAEVMESLFQQGLPENQAGEIADQELQLPRAGNATE